MNSFPKSKHISSRALLVALCLIMVMLGSTVHGADTAAPQKKAEATAGWLGVAIQDVNEQSAKALGLPKTSGSLVDDVLSGQPAMRAGIKPGDVITALEGVEVATARTLLDAIAKLKPGTAAAVTVLRDGKEQIISVTVGERPVSGQGGGCCCGTETGQDAKQGPRLGVIVRALSAEEAQRGGISGGLLVKDVMPGSAAQSAGIRRGDVIVASGKTSVTNAEELGAAVNEAEGSTGVALLRIFRGGQYYFIAVTLPAPVSKK